MANIGIFFAVHTKKSNDVTSKHLSDIAETQHNIDYRLIIFRKFPLLFKLLSRSFFYTASYLEFSFKFSDKGVSKRDVLKNINLYYLKLCSMKYLD